MFFSLLKLFNFSTIKVEYTKVIHMKNENRNVWLKISLNVLYYRRERQLTQAQLAEAIGTSTNHFQRFESNAAGCSVDTLIDIAKALNIPLHKLFEFKD